MMSPALLTLDRRTEEPQYIRCDERGCDLPHAEVRGGCLIIRSRHRGETHVAVIPLARLVELLAA